MERTTGVWSHVQPPEGTLTEQTKGGVMEAIRERTPLRDLVQRFSVRSHNSASIEQRQIIVHRFGRRSAKLNLQNRAVFCQRVPKPANVQGTTFTNQLVGNNSLNQVFGFTAVHHINGWRRFVKGTGREASVVVGKVKAKFG